MLQTIRDRASGWIAYAVVLLISIPFALWGVNHYLDGGGKQVAAEVGGTPISIQDFAQAYREEQLRLQQTFGGQMPPGLDAQAIKQMVLGQLVRDAVFQQAASGAGYRVTDEELLEQLRQYQAFQVDGKFSKARYLQLLQAQGMTPQQFEGRLRRALSIDQLQSGIQQTAFATSLQASEILRLRDQQRDLAYAVIPAAHFAAEIKIDGKAVKHYYDQHKSEYMTAGKVRLDYLRLRAADLRQQIKPDAARLRAYYHDHRAQFRRPESAKAREIVVNFPGSGQGEAAARLKAIASGLSKGEDFSALAKRYSQASSAQRGGDMGEVTRGELPSALANALFALHPGQVTPPIKVGEKVYRLKLEAMQPATEPSFDAIRAEVEAAYVKAETERRFNAEVQRLTTLTYENPGTLGPAAKGLGLKVMSTGWLTRKGGQGELGANAKVVDAAFSDAVLRNGANSQPLELGKHDVVVVRLEAHKPPEQKPMDAVRGEIRAVLVKQAAEAEAASAGKRLVAEVKSGKSLAEAVKSVGAKVQEAGWTGRQGGHGLPAAVTSAAFESPSPKGHAPSVGGVRLAGGDYGVFVVKGVKSPQPDAAEVKAAQAQLGNLFGQVELQTVYQALEQSDGVKVYPNNLNF